MPGTPEHEGPGGAVPQAAEEHDGHQVDEGATPTAAVASQGDIQIIPQPGRQADVPPSPELGDAAGQIGESEILHEAEAHHQTQTDRHVGVSREVKVDLNGVGRGSQPGVGGGRRGQSEGRLGHRGHRIGNQDLFAEVVKDYPEINWLMGHSGGPYGGYHAVEIAQEIPNVYLDITLSMCPARQIEFFVREVGSERVMFGTDNPFIDPRPNIGRVALAEISHDDRVNIFGGNAQRLIKFD